MMRILVHDLRDAGRGLRKQPRFLIVATLTLALGIGAVTAIVSAVYFPLHAAAAASYLPARKAASVSPMEAMRTD